MRYIYSENAPIESHPGRKDRDPIVLINRKTGFPVVAYVFKRWTAYDTVDSYWFMVDNAYIEASLFYWEVAWP